MGVGARSAGRGGRVPIGTGRLDIPRYGKQSRNEHCPSLMRSVPCPHRPVLRVSHRALVGAPLPPAASAREREGCSMKLRTVALMGLIPVALAACTKREDVAAAPPP